MHQGSQFQVLTKTRKVTQVNLEGIGSVPDGAVGYLKKKKRILLLKETSAVDLYA